MRGIGAWTLAIEEAAPGTSVDRSVGALLVPGQEIVNLEQINPLKVDFKVPEMLLAAVKVGQTIRLRLDAMGSRGVEGTVYAIDPLLETGGRAIVLRARIPTSSSSTARRCSTKGTGLPERPKPPGTANGS